MLPPCLHLSPEFLLNKHCLARLFQINNKFAQLHMSSVMPPILKRLWELTGVALDSPAAEWNQFFDPIGLILLGRLHNFEYWCTPSNSITFATTGGDGVHYGLLDIGSGFSDDSPIVMTVPCCDTPNTIVGGSFLDFLRLGCCSGFFTLEQLIYQPNRQLAILDSHHPDPDASEDEIRLLALIRDHFELTPWPTHSDRLQLLAKSFSHHIIAASEPDC
jgi:hypothetical protein